MNGTQQKSTDLKLRTKHYALRVIETYSSLSKSTVSQTLGKQLLRSSTSVAAQYREACRAKSDADMINKFESVLQELDESLLWIELLCEAKIIKSDRAEPLARETNELISIFVASVKRIKARRSLL